MGSNYDDYKDGVEDGNEFSYDKNRYNTDSNYAEGVREGQKRYKARSIYHKPNMSENGEYGDTNYQPISSQSNSEPSATAWVVGGIILLILGYFTGPLIGTLLYIAAGFCALGFFLALLTKK